MWNNESRRMKIILFSIILIVIFSAVYLYSRRQIKRTPERVELVFNRVMEEQKRDILWII